MISVNRMVLIGAVPVFLVLAAVAFIFYRFAANERESQQWVGHTYEVIASIHETLANTQAVESGARGYIITREEWYLKPYEKGRAALPGTLAKLKEFVGDNPTQQKRADELESAVKRKIEVMAAAVELRRNGQFDFNNRPNFGGEAIMQTVRDLTTDMAADERKLLDRRLHDSRLYEQRMITSAIFGAVLALAILLGAALLQVRNNSVLARSEDRRRQQARILQATLDSIREGVAVFDSSEILRAFNRQFFEQMEYPVSLAVVGTRLAAFQAHDESRNRLASLKNIVAAIDGEPVPQRLAVGERDVDVYADNIAGVGFLIASADVTSRVRAESALRQAQKMEAVGHLTGGVAHDFNNLLQIISANLDLAVADTGSNPKLAERIQNAVAAVSRGSRLTGQLLAFARRQALDPRSTNLGRMIQEMTDLLSRTLGERIEVESVVAGGLWNTMVDTSQVENAILNIAINARDAMPDGGKLTIEVANAFLDDAYAAEHAEVVPGQYVMLAISDTGTGMGPDLINRVFEPFFTTKPEGKGTGLGLSQVYGFVKQSGGHIKIYSEIGQGTTVKLYLPRTRKAQEGLAAMPAGRIERGSETLLVVEDDEGVRAAVVDMLNDLGYHVLKADNAEAALVVLSSGARIDLLFTDVVMPGPIPTRELARRAKEMHPDIHVLFTSGYTQNAIVHNGKLDDDVSLLSKPYRKDDLARKLRSLLGAAVSESSAPAPSATQAHRAVKKILVVEDVALIRMTTVDMIEQLGLEALEAADAKEALAILTADSTIDILLTDLGLPGMSGSELADEARKLYPDIGVIIASGYSSAPGNGLAHLMKPFSLEQLREALGA